MATIEDLREWFARDLKFADWNENVEVDESDPDSITVRFYTSTNEYTLKIIPREEGIPRLNCFVRPRKARAGLPPAAARRLLRNAQSPNRLNEKTWRRLVAAIVGYELVRVHRGGKAAKPQGPEEESELLHDLEEAGDASGLPEGGERALTRERIES